QSKIDKSRPDRTPRHGVELRALFTLGEGQTAGRFDRAQTSRAVTAGSGKHDADGARPAFFGERFKEMVDPNIEAFLTLNQPELAILSDDAFARRLDVNSVRLWRGRFCNLAHWHCRHFVEQVGKPAGVMRIEMLHNHKRHS